MSVRALVALFCFGALILSTVAHGRVFDPKELNFAPYLRGTGGDSWMHKEAFAHNNGGGFVDQSSHYTFSGEMGFLFKVAPPLNMRVGAELMSPTPITSAKGYDASGTQIYTMDSQVFIFNPQAAFELIVKDNKEQRWLVTAGAGYAFVTLKNSYTMTTYGQTATSMTDHTEDASGQATNFFFSTGYEFHWVDSVMLMLEGGYRYFPVKKLKYSSDEKSFTAPAGAKKGDPFNNADGTATKFDLSGGFLGLSIRFYLQ